MTLDVGTLAILEGAREGGVWAEPGGQHQAGVTRQPAPDVHNLLFRDSIGANDRYLAPAVSPKHSETRATVHGYSTDRIAQPAYRVVKGVGRPLGSSAYMLACGVRKWGQSPISPMSQFAGRRDQDRGNDQAILMRRSWAPAQPKGDNKRDTKRAT